MIGLCEGDGLEPSDAEGGVKLKELGSEYAHQRYVVCCSTAPFFRTHRQVTDCPEVLDPQAFPQSCHRPSTRSIRRLDEHLWMRC